MVASGDKAGFGVRVADGKTDRLYRDPILEAIEKAGYTQADIRKAFEKSLSEPDSSGETGYVDEICETCCDAHLQIIFQRKTKVVAKGKKSEEWYATIGTMTVRKLTKHETNTIWRSPTNTHHPAHTVEVLLTSDYCELGGPGSSLSGSGKMVKAATHGLAAWGGKRKNKKGELEDSRHKTYGHSTKVGPPPHRALNIKIIPGSQQSIDNMGTRTAINIHVSSHWAWSKGCFLPVPTGMIAYDTLTNEQKEERNKAAGLPEARHREGFIGDKRPYWNGQATLDLMDELIGHVEDFAKQTDQLTAGKLQSEKLLRCVEVIIREPAGEYEIKYMNAEKTGSYIDPNAAQRVEKPVEPQASPIPIPKTKPALIPLSEPEPAEYPTCEIRD